MIRMLLEASALFALFVLILLALAVILGGI